MDIVKATFNGYIQIWEELFDNDFKGKSEFIPKHSIRNTYRKIWDLALEIQIPQINKCLILLIFKI